MAKQANKTEPLLEVDLGKHGGKHVFHSHDEAAVWLQRERDAWNWVPQALEKVRPPNPELQEMWSRYAQSWRPIDKAITRAREHPDEPAHLNEIRGPITAAYVQERLIHSSTPAAKFVLSHRKTDATEALAAMAHLMRVPLLLDRPDLVEGALVAVLYKKGINPAAPQASREALDELHTEMQTLSNDHRREYDAVVKKSTKFDEQAETQLTKYELAHDKLLAERETEYDTAFEAAEQRLRKVEVTYDEKLALRAPVRYWRLRSTFHEKLAKKYAKAFAWGIAVSVLILVPGVTAILWGDTLKPGRIGVSVVLFSLVVWGLSILARNLLSNIHLATDAGERVVMANTYLALLREGKLEEEDRRLILRALFRPSATGIVKDDARPPSVLVDLLDRLKRGT